MTEQPESSNDAIDTRKAIEKHFGWRREDETTLGVPSVEDSKVFPEESDHPAARYAADLFLVRLREFIDAHPFETVAPGDLEDTFNYCEDQRRKLQELSTPGSPFVPLTLRELWGATQREIHDGRERARVKDSQKWVTELRTLQRIAGLIEDALPEDERPHHLE